MKGIAQKWANLPKRNCDNCGTRYQPKRPLMTGERGFCKANCRKEYHKHGGAFGPLRRALDKELKKRIKELSPADATRIEAIESRLEQIENILECVGAAFAPMRTR